MTKIRNNAKPQSQRAPAPHGKPPRWPTHRQLRHTGLSSEQKTRAANKLTRMEVPHVVWMVENGLYGLPVRRAWLVDAENNNKFKKLSPVGKLVKMLWPIGRPPKSSWCGMHGDKTTLPQLLADAASQGHRQDLLSVLPRIHEPFVQQLCGLLRTPDGDELTGDAAQRKKNCSSLQKQFARAADDLIWRLYTDQEQPDISPACFALITWLGSGTPDAMRLRHYCGLHDLYTRKTELYLANKEQLYTRALKHINNCFSTRVRLRVLETRLNELAFAARHNECKLQLSREEVHARLQAVKDELATLTRMMEQQALKRRKRAVECIQLCV